MHPLDLLFVSHSSQLGGAERALLELMEDLSQTDHRRHVLCPRRGPLNRALARTGATVHVVPALTWTSFHRSWRKRGLALGTHVLSSLGAALRFIGTPLDLVCTNSCATPLGALLARLRRVPHLWMFHEYPESLRFDPGERRALRLIRATATAGVITAPSPDLAIALQGTISGPRVALLPQSCRALDHLVNDRPAAAAPLSSPEPGVLRVLSVGTLLPSKGHRDLVEAVARLQVSGTRLVVDIIGEGEPRFVSALREEIARRGVTHAVRLRGGQPSLEPFYAACDVLVHPSHLDALGRTCIEAARHAVPVIATYASGARHWLDEPDTGLFYRAGDVTALCDHLRALNAAPASRHRRGDALRALVERALPSGSSGAAFRELIASDTTILGERLV